MHVSIVLYPPVARVLGWLLSYPVRNTLPGERGGFPTLSSKCVSSAEAVVSSLLLSAALPLPPAMRLLRSRPGKHSQPFLRGTLGVRPGPAPMPQSSHPATVLANAWTAPPDGVGEGSIPAIIATNARGDASTRGDTSSRSSARSPDGRDGMDNSRDFGVSEVWAGAAAAAWGTAIFVLWQGEGGGRGLAFTVLRSECMPRAEAHA